MQLEDGKGAVKLKGAYDHNVAWHQNHSSLVIPKAVEAFLIYGTKPSDYIMACVDPFDFCRTAKVQRNSRLMHGDREVQRVSRYHIAIRGEGLVKVMPPLKPARNVKNPVKLAAWKEYQDLQAAVDAQPNGYGDVPGDARSDSRLARLAEMRASLERHNGIDVGFAVNVCNDIREFDWSNLNRHWYIHQAQKLIDALGVKGS